MRRPRHKVAMSVGQVLWIFVVTCVAPQLSADGALDRLYTVLREHGISFDTNMVTEAAIEAAIKKIDPGARLMALGEPPSSSPVATVVKREEWAEGIGYLKMGGLFKEGKKEVIACLQDWISQTRHGVILDLRGAGGNDLDSVDELAGFFLPTETNLYQIVNGCGRVLEVHSARRTKTTMRSNVILIILVDGLTTGASELFAAALQNAGGVLVVGSPTVGDNALREQVPFLGDRALYIATRRVTLLNGHEYNNGKGICPDIEVRNGSRRETVTNRLTSRYDRTPSEKAQRDFQLMQRVADDPVLARAVDILLALTALEYHESRGTTNTLDAARL